MDIVRLQNVWYLQFLLPKFREKGAVDAKIVWQELDKPILPAHANNLTTEYIDIYIVEEEQVRVALFVEVKDAKQRRELREYTMSVYDDARFEKI